MLPTPKERGIIRRQNKLRKKQRQQEQSLIHCQNVQTCMLEIGHLIMQYLSVFDQLQLNRAQKVWYVNLLAHRPNKSQVTVFRQAYWCAHNMCVLYRPDEIYDPLTRLGIPQKVFLTGGKCCIDEYIHLIRRRRWREDLGFSLPRC